MKFQVIISDIDTDADVKRLTAMLAAFPGGLPAIVETSKAGAAKESAKEKAAAIAAEAEAARVPQTEPLVGQSLIAAELAKSKAEDAAKATALPEGTDIKMVEAEARKLVNHLAMNGKKDGVVAILQSYGVGSVTDFVAQHLDKLPEFYVKIKAL